MKQEHSPLRPPPKHTTTNTVHILTLKFTTILDVYCVVEWEPEHAAEVCLVHMDVAVFILYCETFSHPLRITRCRKKASTAYNSEKHQLLLLYDSV